MLPSGEVAEPLGPPPKVGRLNTCSQTPIKHRRHRQQCWLTVGSPLQRLDFTAFNPLADPDFCFYDDTLLESVKVGDEHTHEFFRLLSLCHTVMSEEKSEGESVSE